MSVQEDVLYTFKIIIVGQAWAGKTSIMKQLFKGKPCFDDSEVSTVGASFYCKTLSDIGVKLHYWDTAGQERYDALLQMYYRNSALILLVVDLADFSDSFKRLKKYYRDIENNNYDGSYILIGNKTDLLSEDEILKRRGKMLDFIKDKNSFHCYMEVSAKTYYNIPELSEQINSIAKVLKERALKKKDIENTINHKIIKLEQEANWTYAGYFWSLC